MGITPQQFEQIKKRLATERRTAGAVPGSTSSPPAAAHAVVIGIDPSLRGTGYGIVRTGKPQSRAGAFGTIVCPSAWERSRCLVRTAEVLRDVIAREKPTACVIEGLFFAQNLQTALIMGEARGVCLLAAAEAGLPIVELAPRKVKQAIVGYGAAQKFAVAKMVQRMLHLAEIPDPDAADALALALVFLQENNRFNLSAPKRV